MSYLKELLNVYWLRPETALWRTFDCLLMENYELLQPSLDMGTGDGVLSYIMAGGSFGEDFDVYTSVGELNNYLKGEDIYNTVANLPAIKYSAKRLRHNYSVGIDHKKDLLEKARSIEGLYKSVMQYDLNYPLPFKEECFETVFCNILYWLTDLDIVLAGVFKVLRRNGRMFVFVPNENFKRQAWIYYADKKQSGHSYLNFLDRGYGSLIKHCYHKGKWVDIFKRNGFSVADHRQYLSKTVMEIWNIGTRPISHLLISMSKRLSESDRAAVKSEWICFFNDFFAPLVRLESDFDKEMEPAFHFFVLEKK